MYVVFEKYHLSAILKYHIHMKMFQDRNIATSNYAGATFLTSMHITSWKPTNQTSDLFIEEYLNSTHAFDDRKKYMFIPIRMKPGTCWTHSCDRWAPFEKYDKSIHKHFN